ncbi:hypothetical protein ACFFGH_02355 [Lysobacter korlensis]|uniref:Uncharacterized protein n=1 Tax=Lysobacter korlensis TaxID=553636 RepID=A0ABV6RIV7_9GAMM
MPGPVADHVWIAAQVAKFLQEFGKARRLEAHSAGVAEPHDPSELTAGLACGVARAYRRMGGHPPNAVPRALRLLAERHVEFADVETKLMSQLGSDAIAAWADLAEAVVDAVERGDDRMAPMLEFARILRVQSQRPADPDAQPTDPNEGHGVVPLRRGGSYKHRRP